MKGLTSVYAALQPYNSWAEAYERYLVVDEYRSDLITFRDDVTSWMDVASFTNEATGSVSKSEWTYLYKGINYANQCIDNIPNIQVDSEDGKALQKQAVAEARFCVLIFTIVCIRISVKKFLSICTSWKVRKKNFIRNRLRPENW